MQEATNIYDKIISMYGPEGAYGKAAEQVLGLQKVRDVGATAQRDISRGLYGIRPYEQEWEATTGATARLTLEDIKLQRQASALGAKASFITGIETPYPDYGSLMQAVQAQASTPSYAPSSGGGGSAFPSTWGESTPFIGQPANVSPATSTTGTAPIGGYASYGTAQETTMPTTTVPTAPKQDVSARIRAAKTYEEYKSIAEGAGLRAGPKDEWEISKRLGFVGQA